jgi:hypothetical protein
MQQMCMRKVIDDGMVINPSRDPDTPQIQDWTPYYNKVERMIKAFNALEVNCLYTALQQDEEDEDGDKVVLPMMQGKGTQYAKKVVSWMTSFGHMRVARRRIGKNEDDSPKYEEFRVIQWKASKTVMAKDRTRCLEPKTIIGDGKLGGLKDVRELLEAGPAPAPQPGRVVQKPKNQKPVKEKTENNMELLSVSVGDDDEEDS